MKKENEDAKPEIVKNKGKGEIRGEITGKNREKRRN